jgi:hypothetical protein
VNLSEPTRAYIYRALLALQPLAVAYGLVTDNLAALWINVAAAVLGIGLATANTSTKAPTRGEHVADVQAAGNDRTAFPYA